MSKGSAVLRSTRPVRAVTSLRYAFARDVHPPRGMADCRAGSLPPLKLLLGVCRAGLCAAGRTREDRGPRAMLSPVAEHDLLCSRVPLAAALGHSGLGSVEVMFALHCPAGCTVVQQPMHCRRLSRVAAPCVRCYCVRSLRWAWPIRRVISKSG